MQVADSPIFSDEEARVFAKADLGWMSTIPYKESYSITLDHLQISELERLVRGYSEALAQYNTLGAGKQSTLDTLTEVWIKIELATKEN